MGLLAALAEAVADLQMVALVEAAADPKVHLSPQYTTIDCVHPGISR